MYSVDVVGVFYFILYRHLSFFRESFRQLGVQQPSQQLLQSSTDCSTAIPFNRQTTIECFEVREVEWSGREWGKSSLFTACSVLPCKETKTQETD